MGNSRNYVCINLLLYWVFMSGNILVLYGMLDKRATLIHGLISTFLTILAIFTGNKSISFSVIPIAMFLVIPAITILVNVEQIDVFGEYIRRGLKFLILIALIQNRKKLYLLNYQKMILLSLFVSIIPIMMFFIGYRSGLIYMSSYYYGYNRYAYPFVGPHNAAAFMYMAIVFSVILLQYIQSSLTRLAVNSYVGVLVFAIVLTGTRNMLISTLILLAGMVLTGRGTALNKLIGVLLMIMSTIKVLNTNLFIDFKRYINGSNVINMVGGGRFFIWENSMREIMKSNPVSILVGRGYGTDNFVAIGQSISQRIVNSHSDLLTTIIEIGVIGLLAFVSLVILLTMRVIRNKHVTNYIKRFSVLFVVSSFFSYATSNSFYTRVVPSIMFIVIIYLLPAIDYTGNMRIKKSTLVPINNDLG